MSDNPTFRAEVLASYGAGAAQTEELLAYNENVFRNEGTALPRFPLQDEPFVGAWEGYVREAEDEGVQACLERRFAQFLFPIREGVSATEEYRAATRRGNLPADAEPLRLQAPERCRIVLHPTSAGRIPLIITGDRRDFVSCVRAFTKRNEPAEIPASQGACMVAGYNNWDRIRQLRRAWEAASPVPVSEEAWDAEFQRLIPQKELYQDRFIILSDGPYSGIRAEEMDLPDGEWKAASLVIRREHECCHYFTRRVFGSMRNNVIDELIADYTGVVAANGVFRAGWVLRFMGLARYPEYQPTGRLEIYRGTLSDGAFRILRALLKSAAEHLEQFHCRHAAVLAQPAVRALAITLLTGFTVEELAAPEAARRLSESLAGHLRETDGLSPIGG